jgi:hypothetical protein
VLISLYKIAKRETEEVFIKANIKESKEADYNEDKERLEEK